MTLTPEKFLTDTFGFVTITMIVYVLGWFSNEIADRIFAKKHEAKLKLKAKHAIQAIYEAEKKLSGRKRGAEKLIHACNLYMAKSGEKNYDAAQKQILSVFPLIKLSK